MKVLNKEDFQLAILVGRSELTFSPTSPGLKISWNIKLLTFLPYKEGIGAWIWDIKTIFWYLLPLMTKDWRLLYKDSGSKYASQCFHVIAKMHEDTILSHQWHRMVGPFIHPVLYYIYIYKGKPSYLTCATGLLQVDSCRLSSIWVNSFHPPELLGHVGRFPFQINNKTLYRKNSPFAASPKHQKFLRFLPKATKNNPRTIFPGFPAGRPAHTVRTMTESPSWWFSFSCSDDLRGNHNTGWSNSTSRDVSFFSNVRDVVTQVCQIRSLSSKSTHSWEVLIYTCCTITYTYTVHMHTIYLFKYSIRKHVVRRFTPLLNIQIYTSSVFLVWKYIYATFTWLPWWTFWETSTWRFRTPVGSLRWTVTVGSCK